MPKIIILRQNVKRQQNLKNVKFGTFSGYLDLLKDLLPLKTVLLCSNVTPDLPETIEKMFSHGSRKVFICGFIVDGDDIPNMPNVIRSLMEPHGGIDELIIKPLPDMYVMPECRVDGRKAMAATVMFKSRHSPSMAMQESGKVINNSVVEVMTISEGLTIEDIVRNAGVPEWEAKIWRKINAGG